MKILFSFFLLIVICFSANSKETVYVGSTPADPDVRDFLGISLIDSIDFIRWNVVIRSDRYDLNCHYGLSKPSTNGFNGEKKVMFSGPLSKQGNYYHLQRGNKTFYLLEINSNLLHLLDKNKNLLVGNGGYSYALNSSTPVKNDQFNLPLKKTPMEYLMAFQGRTPCQELSTLLGRETSPACDKMKWYIIFYSDSITGKPSYYIEGGRGYKKETMEKGRWEIIGKNGRIIYKLDIEKRPYPLYLLKADDNILFFTDAQGNLLVGNENFSYTLNRTKDREAEINR
jgi:hypothetical protein